MEKMLFQMAVVAGQIDVFHEPESGDLLVVFENPHRAAAHQRFQLRFKADAEQQLIQALVTPPYP